MSAQPQIIAGRTEPFAAGGTPHRFRVESAAVERELDMVRHGPPPPSPKG